MFEEENPVQNEVVRMEVEKRRMRSVSVPGHIGADGKGSR